MFTTRPGIYFALFCMAFSASFMLIFDDMYYWASVAISISIVFLAASLQSLVKRSTPGMILKGKITHQKAKSYEAGIRTLKMFFVAVTLGFLFVGLILGKAESDRQYKSAFKAECNKEGGMMILTGSPKSTPRPECIKKESYISVDKNKLR